MDHNAIAKLEIGGEEMRLKKREKPWNWLGPVIIVMAFICLCLVVGGLMGGEKKTRRAAKQTQDSGVYVDLDAALSWDGRAFTVTNKGRADWTSIMIEINAPLLGSGYRARVSRIGIGRSITVKPSSFAKPDGTIFNPRTHRPNQVTILCTIRGKKGFWLGTLG